MGRNVQYQSNWYSGFLLKEAVLKGLAQDASLNVVGRRQEPVDGLGRDGPDGGDLVH